MKFSTGFTNQHPALNKTHQPAIPRTDQSNNKDVDKSYQLNLTYFTIKVSNFIKREEQSATFQKAKMNTPLSQRPGENLLASGDKMKKLNANGDGKSVGLNEWGFQILLLTVQKSSGDSQNFSVNNRI